MALEFIITSRRGMSVWATVHTPTDAIREQRRAQQQGLDGEIYPVGTDEEMADEIGAAGGYTEDWRTAGTAELQRRICEQVASMLDAEPPSTLPST